MYPASRDSSHSDQRSGLDVKLERCRCRRRADRLVVLLLGRGRPPMEFIALGRDELRAPLVLAGVGQAWRQLAGEARVGPQRGEASRVPLRRRPADFGRRGRGPCRPEGTCCSTARLATVWLNPSPIGRSQTSSARRRETMRRADRRAGRQRAVSTAMGPHRGHPLPRSLELAHDRDGPSIISSRSWPRPVGHRDGPFNAAPAEPASKRPLVRPRGRRGLGEHRRMAADPCGHLDARGLPAAAWLADRAGAPTTTNGLWPAVASAG